MDNDLVTEGAPSYSSKPQLMDDPYFYYCYFYWFLPGTTQKCDRRAEPGRTNPTVEQSGGRVSRVRGVVAVPRLAPPGQRTVTPPSTEHSRYLAAQCGDVALVHQIAHLQIETVDPMRSTSNYLPPPSCRPRPPLAASSSSLCFSSLSFVACWLWCCELSGQFSSVLAFSFCLKLIQCFTVCVSDATAVIGKVR